MSVTSYGYSAATFRTFLINIVVGRDIDVMPDSIAIAVDEARSIGRCFICPTSLERRLPASFAVMVRAGGYEPPVAKPICVACTIRFGRAELRQRALRAFHGEGVR